MLTRDELAHALLNESNSRVRFVIDSKSYHDPENDKDLVINCYFLGQKNLHASLYRGNIAKKLDYVVSRSKRWIEWDAYADINMIQLTFRDIHADGELKLDEVLSVIRLFKDKVIREGRL